MPLIMIPMLMCICEEISRKEKEDKTCKLTENDHIKLLYIAKKYQLCMVNINTAKNQHKIRKKYFFSRAASKNKGHKAKI